MKDQKNDVENIDKLIRAFNNFIPSELVTCIFVKKVSDKRHGLLAKITIYGFSSVPWEWVYRALNEVLDLSDYLNPSLIESEDIRKVVLFLSVKQLKNLIVDNVSISSNRVSQKIIAEFNEILETEPKGINLLLNFRSSVPLQGEELKALRRELIMKSVFTQEFIADLQKMIGKLPKRRAAFVVFKAAHAKATQDFMKNIMAYTSALKKMLSEVIPVNQAVEIWMLIIKQLADQLFTYYYHLYNHESRRYFSALQLFLKEKNLNIDDFASSINFIIAIDKLMEEQRWRQATGKFEFNM